ncbi:MAG: ATP:cob(I)alamin adenosyltransferase [Gemmataceae bacterium]
MVYLSRIYTRTGDTGETALGDGRRVAKDHPRVVAYGSVDELNACLGLLVEYLRDEQERQLVRSLQNDLFDVGADLCVPEEEHDPGRLRVGAEYVERLEHLIDRLNEPLPPLTSFVLPGGTPAVAWCHLARTVCRRAEREVVALMRTARIGAPLVAYLNRLSDLLFVLARHLQAKDKAPGWLWSPGTHEPTWLPSG